MVLAELSLRALTDRASAAGAAYLQARRGRHLSDACPHLACSHDSEKLGKAACHRPLTAAALLAAQAGQAPVGGSAGRAAGGRRCQARWNSLAARLALISKLYEAALPEDGAGPRKLRKERRWGCLSSVSEEAWGIQGSLQTPCTDAAGARGEFLLPTENILPADVLAGGRTIGAFSHPFAGVFELRVCIWGRR